MAINDHHSFLKSLQPSELIRDDLGAFSFVNSSENLLPIFKMVVDLADCLENSFHAIPEHVQSTAIGYINEFAELAKKLKDYTVTPDNNVRNSIISQSAQLVNNFSQLGYNAFSFYVVFSIVKSISFEAHNYTQVNSKIDFLNSQLEDLKAPVDEKSARLDDLSIKLNNDLEKVIEESQKQVTHRYAKMFQIQAIKHKDDALIWLLCAVAGIIGLLVFIAYEDKLLPIQEHASATLVTIESIKRFLVVSFIIYLIGMCFKQYGIQKHLQTLNTHRQNTLSSFELFIQSVGSAEQDVRQTLMVEIARAIYDSGQTGYINVKDDGGGTSSIMEITKYLKPDK